MSKLHGNLNFLSGVPIPTIWSILDNNQQRTALLSDVQKTYKTIAIKLQYVYIFSGY